MSICGWQFVTALVAFAAGAMLPSRVSTETLRIGAKVSKQLLMTTSTALTLRLIWQML